MAQILSRRALFATLGSGVLLTTGAALAQGAEFVPVQPPPPRREVRPHRPGERFEWQEGHWRWDGRAHVWVPGLWVEAPRPRAHWVPGHWDRGPRGWFWIEGHWA